MLVTPLETIPINLDGIIRSKNSDIQYKFEKVLDEQGIDLSVIYKPYLSAAGNGYLGALNDLFYIQKLQM